MADIIFFRCTEQVSIRLGLRALAVDDFASLLQDALPELMTLEKAKRVASELVENVPWPLCLMFVLLTTSSIWFWVLWCSQPWIAMEDGKMLICLVCFCETWVENVISTSSLLFWVGWACGVWGRGNGKRAKWWSLASGRCAREGGKMPATTACSSARLGGWLWADRTCLNLVGLTWINAKSPLLFLLLAGQLGWALH